MPTVRELLDSLERELLKKLDALRAQTQPLEAELGDVKRARLAVGGTALPSIAEMIGGDVMRYARMTNKELALQALTEHFPQGATAAELLRFFKADWGREIDLSSFSPQLSRLVQAGVLEKEGRVWKIKQANQSPANDSGHGDGVSVARDN